MRGNIETGHFTLWYLTQGKSDDSFSQIMMFSLALLLCFKNIYFYFPYLLLLFAVAKPCPALGDPIDCNMSGSSVLHYLLEFAQIYVHWVGDVSNHLILCYHLLLLPLIFPSIEVVSNESALCIRWPKNWSSSLRDSFSNEYSRLISFWIGWFDLLAVQGTLKNLLHTTIKNHQFFATPPSLWFNSHIHT